MDNGEWVGLEEAWEAELLRRFDEAMDEYRMRKEDEPDCQD